MKILILIVLLLIIAYIEVIPLVRKHQKKEAAASFGLLLCSLVVSILILKDVKIPSPSRAIEQIVSVLIKR